MFMGLTYTRDGEYVVWDISAKDSYFFLYRNGYLFGDYYYPVYLNYTEWFKGIYKDNKNIPMLAMLDNTVGFLFYDHKIIREFYGTEEVYNPHIIIAEPEPEPKEETIYYDENVVWEYNSIFNTNIKPVPNPIIAYTIKFRSV